MSNNVSTRKVIVSGMIANALEWYDYVLYVQFATIISKLFFPPQDGYNALIFTYGVFAAGFIMRPLGGILFGYLGDKFGRKSSLVFSILMMSIPTAFIGFLPSFDQIGIWAPILLTLIRLLQGLSLGGGFSGCMTFLVEHAPANKRGIIGSSSMFSLGAGVLLGIGVSSLIASIMDNNQFENWGWRIPFAISLFIGLIAFYIKNNVSESPVYEQAKNAGKISKTPLVDVLKDHKSSILKAIGVYLTVTVPFYAFTAYFNTHMHKTMGHSMHDTLILNGLAMILFIIIMPISGMVSDKIGRKPVLLFSALALAVSAYPVFLLLNQQGLMLPLIGQIIFAIFLGIYMGPVPATLVELFPTSIRFTGLALSYNISALFGGTVPMVFLWLTNKTQLHTAPSFYIILFVVVTVIAIYKYNDRYDLALAE